MANYRVIIEPDEETGNGKSGFTAYVPKLGIADSGYTVEEAMENIRSLLKFHLECLIKEGVEIPTSDHQDAFVTNTSVTLAPRYAKRFQQLAIA